ncbi:hypothetical protein EE612_014431 [Oryza sativa]|nr:hypothetical protein EE612_014431 [Oryza sativa]
MAATAGDAAAACPAYPWPSDGAQRGRKVFMQSDRTACHGMFSSNAGGDRRRGGGSSAGGGSGDTPRRRVLPGAGPHLHCKGPARQ